MKLDRWGLVGAFAGLLLAMGVSAQPARADVITNYTINFSETLGTLPTSGSFTYDSTTDQFSNFLVDWDGTTFNLTTSANAPYVGPTDSATGCSGETSDGAYSFEILSKTLTGCSPTYTWYDTGGNASFYFDAYTDIFVQGDSIISSNTGSGSDSQGTWTISAVTTTPEPSTSMLTLLGSLPVLLLLFRRKRIA